MTGEECEGALWLTCWLRGVVFVITWDFPSLDVRSREKSRCLSWARSTMMPWCSGSLSATHLPQLSVIVVPQCISWSTAEPMGAQDNTGPNTAVHWWARVPGRQGCIVIALRQKNCMS